MDEVRRLVATHPRLIHEMARGTERCNWGPPMSYAANLGRDQIILALHELGTTDLQHAIGRASLQGKIATAHMLHDLMGRPRPPVIAWAALRTPSAPPVQGSCKSLAAQVRDEHGKRLAPVDVVLESDSRKPSAKHEILEMYVRHGLELPDTPPMALHRGRIDLLPGKPAPHNPRLLERTFTHEEDRPAGVRLS